MKGRNRLDGKKEKTGCARDKYDQIWGDETQGGHLLRGGGM